MILKRKSRILAVAIAAVMCITGIPMSAYAAQTADNGLATGYVKIEETQNAIAPGISDKKIVMNTESGNQQNIVFATEIDMSAETTGIMAGYKNYDGSEFGLQATTDQAKAAEKKTGKNIVAAINADYFDMTTGATTGALVMNGVKYMDTNGRPYFAILKDGTAVIRDGSVPLDDVMEAVGGDPLIVKDGKFTVSPSDGGYDAIPYSRTAIGIKANGNVVTLVTHGRINPVSYGMNMFEMAEILMGQGCEDVLILDGGGSSTYAAKYEGTDKLAVVNNPSDGKERMVSSTLFITSSAKPTGEFDHANISPNNTVYTPGSEVQFEAVAVDSSGTKVDMPADITWRLAAGSESKGTIDQVTGKFTSNEAAGEVVVEMVQSGNVVGSTNITIAQPDEISFTNEEISIGFSKQSDLGLTVKYQGRTVNYKAGDFVWTITPEDEGFKPEDMGTFEGNIFTSSEGNSVNGTIKCESKWDAKVSGEIYAIIGMLPKIIMGFEDETDEAGNVVTPAEQYWLGNEETTGLITTKTYGRGGKEELSLVDVAEDEEHVRFDGKALKIDYDFTQATGTEGAGVGYTTNTQIEGTPTAVGMWVYAPEGTANLWLRIRVNDGDGQVQNLDFTKEIDKSISDTIKGGNNWTGDKELLGGINWTGWHYVEAPLTDKEGNPLKGPFELRTGELIRVMYVPGTGMGMALPDGTFVGQAERKGSLYIDNVRFVYGANVDDLDAPSAEYITINDTQINDGMTVDTNTVTLKASLYDEPGTYMTGIDWDRVHTYIDGKEVAFQQAGEMLQISNLGLGNGTHKFKLVICDGFGNKTTETREFEVEGESDFTTITAKRVTEGDVMLNSTQEYVITANHGDKLSTFEADVQLNKLFAEDTIKVEFNEAVEGTYSYDAATGVMHIKGSMKDGTAVTGKTDLAVLKCFIPAETADGVKFRIGVNNGSYTLKEASEQITTFSGKEFSADVKPAYKVSADALTVGSDDGVIYVKDMEGNAIEGAEVYMTDGTRLGMTGSKGYLRAKKLTAAAGIYEVYAVKDDAYSFITKIGVLEGAGNEDGYPTQVTSVVTDDPSSEKAVSWFSNPDAADKTAIMQIAPSSEYAAKGEAAFENVTGTAKAHNFDSGSVYINTVHATGLAYDTEYTYRVGDGNYWSEVNTFTLKKDNTDANLFIIGDAQSEDTTNVDKIVENLFNSGVDFNAGIQTGDLVDSGKVYTNWTSALDIFAKNKDLSSTEILHAIGNHEREGDSELIASQSIFNMPNTNHYSVEYGNVYVATISYAFSEAQLKADLEWLVEDAAKSDALWKVVVTHQPAYYTNTAGSNELMHELLPAAAEQAGIDFVFAGHDHAYARTEPLKGGEVDAENGIVYYICGSTGEKSYSISDNKDFHFAELNDEFEAIYLTVNATDKQFTVKTHELDGTVIDEYVKESTSECMTSGHDYVYDGSSYLECGDCHYARPVAGYTGFTADETMYFINGTMQHGWMTLDKDIYYFGEDGTSQTVEITKEVASECTKNGYKIYYCEAASESDGKELKVKDAAQAAGHKYGEDRVCTVCGWEEASIKDCEVSIKYKKYAYTGSEIKPFVTVKLGDKKLNGYYDYRVTYENNVETGTATITVNPKTKYWANINENHGSLKWEDPVVLTFKIVPKKATGLTWKCTGINSVKLTWNAAEGADDYQIYRWNADTAKWVWVKNVAGTETTVKNIPAAARRTFKVVARAAVTEGEKTVYYKSVNAPVCYTATRPTQEKITELTGGTKQMTVKWTKKAGNGYQIVYAKNAKFTNAKTININKANVTNRTIKNLAKGKYFVKVRAYKTSYKGVKVYGKYSPYKVVTVK